MNTKPSTATPVQFRFGLADLLSLMTVSAVILASTPWTGPLATLCLVAMAVALFFRWGMVAVLMFLAAQVAAEMQRAQYSAGESFFTFMAGLAVLAWYRFQRYRRDQCAEQRLRYSNITLRNS